MSITKENLKPKWAAAASGSNNTNGSMHSGGTNGYLQKDLQNGTQNHAKASETLQLGRPALRQRAQRISGSKHAQAAARKYKNEFAVH